jgi:hypothetical protein
LAAIAAAPGERSEVRGHRQGAALNDQRFRGPLTVRSLAEAFIKADFGDGSGRPTVATKNGDDAIFETYLQHAGVTGYYEREARTAWALFKSLCDKPLKECDRDDGRKVVQHFREPRIAKREYPQKEGLRGIEWVTFGAEGPINRCIG